MTLPISPRDLRERYASDLSLLPVASPLAMLEQQLGAPCPAQPPIDRSRLLAPRVALLAAALLLTAAFGYEMYGVLAFVRMTPIQLVFLVLSTIAFGWVALGSLSAALGFLPLFAREQGGTLELPPADGSIVGRTALLFPVYHEEPARIAGTIEAIARQLASLGKADKFDVFVLSDTRGDDAGREEERAYARLVTRLARVMPVHYRRRTRNTAKKAGNIKDWVERFGGAYPHFVILDADSVMSGETLVRLARAMDADPRAGLIQTMPRLTGGDTLFQRMQQYAGGVYGPAVATGVAAWTGDQGNYWGHNAIIRTVAFATSAGLPELPGAAPFGGHIQSHDFVEAALLQRNGWGVLMAPTADGSYEGAPPSLIDLVVRDRRWAQGNLQHLGVLARARLTRMGRLHLAMGAASYLVSAVWAASLAVGMVLAMQGEHIIPSYFHDGRSLFPIWPVIDPGAALRLFCATMAVVMLPKLLGLALELARAREERDAVGMARAVGAVLVETVLSMLFAPILMATQTTAVVQILMGRDSGWKAQRREAGGLPLADAARFHFWHFVLGVALGLTCWIASPYLLAWMGPVVAGLVLSVPLTWLSARPAGRILGWLLSTSDDRNPPAILDQARARAAAWREVLARDEPSEPQRELARAA